METREKDRAVLGDLLVRLREAKGPDRELDAAVWKALRPKTYRELMYAASGLRPKGEPRKPGISFYGKYLKNMTQEPECLRKCGVGEI